MRKAGCKAAKIYTTLPIHVTTSSSFCLEKTGDEKLSPPRKVARPRRRRISRQMAALCFFPRGVSFAAQIISPRETKRVGNQPRRARHTKELREVRRQPSSCPRMLKLLAMHPYLKNACILFLQVDTRLHESERMAACLGRTYYLIVSKRQSQRRLRASWSNPETGLGSFRSSCFFWFLSGTKARLLWDGLPMAFFFFKTFQAFLGRRGSVTRRDFDRAT